MTVTDTARDDLYAGDGVAIYHELVTIEADALTAPIRVVNAREEDFVLRSRGEDFIGYPFMVTWPARDASQPFAGATLVVGNVVATDGTNEPVLLAQLRSIGTRARIRFEVVRRDAPDTVEARTTRLRLTGVTYDSTTITGTLELPDFTGRRAGGRFTPDNYPNLRAV